MITGLGAGQGKNLSFHAMCVPSKSFLTPWAHLVAQKTLFLKLAHNVLPEFNTHLPSFIIIWQVSFKKKIHLMKYFRLNTSTLDLQKCTPFEYI